MVSTHPQDASSKKAFNQMRMREMMNTQAAQIPNEMVIVTKEQFFAALEADGRDIMPSVNHPYQTTWETKSRELWGWESTGWKSEFDAENVRAVYPSALAKGAA